MPKHRWNVLRTLAVLSLMLSASACGTSIADTSCVAFGPITYSSRDTPETQTAVEEHNVRWHRLCGW